MSESNDHHPSTPELSPADVTALDDLRRIYSECYSITVSAGVWDAFRVSDRLRSHKTSDPEKLRKWLHEDLAQWRNETKKAES
jgi:hypothetical protein